MKKIYKNIKALGISQNKTLEIIRNIALIKDNSIIIKYAHITKVFNLKNTLPKIALERLKRRLHTNIKKKKKNTHNVHFIFKFSVEQNDLKKACEEWQLHSINDTKSYGEGSNCMCGAAIRYEQILINKITGREIIVGSSCVNEILDCDVQNFQDNKINRHNVEFLRKNSKASEDDLLYLIETKNKRKYDKEEYERVRQRVLDSLNGA